MNAMTRNALGAYNKVGMETALTSASPHKLILMLYEGARLAANEAKQHMLDGNIAKKGEAVSKAIMIIDHGLKASLDSKAGGEIAQRLEALYDHMSSRLLIANLKNQPEGLDEVILLLAELHSAWVSIGTATPPRTAEAAAAPPPSQDRVAISYGKV